MKLLKIAAIIGITLAGNSARAGEINEFNFLIESDGSITELSGPTLPPPDTTPNYNGYFYLGNSAEELNANSRDEALDTLAERASRYCYFTNPGSYAEFVRSTQVTATPAFLASVHPGSNSTVVVDSYSASQGTLPTILSEVRCR